MNITNNHSDDAVLLEIGERISQYRLNQNKTRANLAREAGVSNRTLARMEHGHSVQATSLIRVLRALGLLANINTLIQESVLSPIQQLKMQGKRRQRASSKRTQEVKEPTWSWGDEE